MGIAFQGSGRCGHCHVDGEKLQTDWRPWPPGCSSSCSKSGNSIAKCEQNCTQIHLFILFQAKMCVCVCVGMKANIKIMNKVRWANLFYINSWMFVTTINIVDMFFNFLLSVSTYVWVILYMHVQKWLNISFGYTDSYWRLSVFQFRIWSTNFTKFVLRL